MAASGSDQKFVGKQPPESLQDSDDGQRHLADAGVIQPLAERRIFCNCPSRFYRPEEFNFSRYKGFYRAPAPGLPDFSRYNVPNIPKVPLNYQIAQKFTIHMAVMFLKWP
jgi:hypothetical protein